jgi:hypothetical protein
VDYQRNNFSISQAAFARAPDLVAITPPPPASIVGPVIALTLLGLAIISFVSLGIRSCVRGRKTKRREQLLSKKWTRAHTVDLGMKQKYDDGYVYHLLGFDPQAGSRE